MRESAKGNLIAESDEDFGKAIREHAFELARKRAEIDGVDGSIDVEMRVTVHFDTAGEGPRRDDIPEPRCVCVWNGVGICYGSRCNVDEC